MTCHSSESNDHKSTSCELVRRCHRLLRRLRDLPEELESENDPAFMTEQINFLKKRFAELRLLLLENQPVEKHMLPRLEWPTNRSRTVKCSAVLASYGGFSLAENLIHLLTDARHWCDWHGESLGDLDRQAHRHYLAELDQPEGIKS